MAENDNIATVRAYFKALEAGEAGERLSRFFGEQALQIELPNKLNPAGGTSDLATIKRRSEEGKHLLQEQRYTLISTVAEGDNLAVEAEWTGVLAVPVAGLPTGYEMKAHLAMFFKFKDGRIVLQRNYDCFEAW